MKRIGFKPQFVGAILDGTKTATLRPSWIGVNEGEIIAAMTGDGKKPWFHRPASEAFAHIRINRTIWIPRHQAFPDAVDKYKRFGFTSKAEAKAFYEGSLTRSIAYLYEFELVPQDVAK